MNDNDSSLSPRSAIWLAIGSIVLLTALAYSASFDGPYIFDDFSSIPGSQYVTGGPFSLSAFYWEYKATTSARPLVAYSFALNHEISGLNVWSYHAVNLLLHLGSALVLFAIIRRTLIIGNGSDPNETSSKTSSHSRALLFAWAAALLWAVHPINSESVLYLVQRTGLMFGLFSLLAIRFLIAAHQNQPSRRYPLLTLLSVVAAMGCKEHAVVMPIVLLLFDRAFLAGSFATAFRKRGPMYGLLVVCVGVLAILSYTLVDRGGIATTSDLAWRYMLTQGGVILMYLKLVAWPYPLSVSYELIFAQGLSDSLPGSLIVFVLLIASVYAVVRYPKVGCLAMSFFLILAPDSSVLPILTEMAGERRMYLPSISVLLLAGALIVFMGAKLRQRGMLKASQPLFVTVTLLLAMAGAGLTFLRSFDYDTEHKIWAAALEARPQSVYALSTMAAFAIKDRQFEQAHAYLDRLDEIDPLTPNAATTRGRLLVEEGRYAEALNALARELKYDPQHLEANAWAAYALGMLDRHDMALNQFSKVFALEPDHILGTRLLGLIMLHEGDATNAVTALNKAASLSPADRRVHLELGSAYIAAGQMTEARSLYQQLLEVWPDDMDVIRAAATFEAAQGNNPEALRLRQLAVELSPQSVFDGAALAELYIQIGYPDQAEAIYRELLKAHPDDPMLKTGLGRALRSLGRYSEAQTCFQEAVQLAPDAPEPQAHLQELQHQAEPAQTQPASE